MLHYGHEESDLVSRATRHEHTESLEQYRLALVETAQRGDYADEASSINLPADQTLAARSNELADQLRTDALKYVFVIGIGGSNLGTKAVYDALGGVYDTLAPRRPQLVWVDTVSAPLLATIESIIASVDTPEEIVIVLISKSGSTAETVFNAEVLLSKVRARFDNAAYQRTVIITDEGSALWEHALGLSITTLPIPKLVGGRFSVFSPVGLFPLALAGFATEELLAGARAMREASLEDTETNAARASAVALFANYRKGIVAHDLFLFDPRLHSLGLWYRQLLGESVGKEKDRDDAVVHVGMIPTVSIGSTDLHSVGQLYLGGPKNIFTTFVEVTDPGVADPIVPDERIFPHLLPMLDRVRAGEVVRAISEGTKTAYRNASLPYSEVVLDVVSPFSIGAFMQMHMFQVMYLSVLLYVNAFDQPNVESYKIETKRILEDRH